MNNYLRGEKRTCPFCATKFFDFKKSKIECPKCNKEIIIESLSNSPLTSKNTISNKNEEELLAVQSLDDDVEDNLENDTINEDENNSTLINIDE